MEKETVQVERSNLHHSQVVEVPLEKRAQNEIQDDSKTAQPPPQLVADSLRQVAWTNGEVDAPHGKLKQDLPILHWAFGVGCDFSGFFVEMLGMLRALQDRLPRFWADFGDCSPKMFGLLAQQEVLNVQTNHQRRPVGTAPKRVVKVQHHPVGSGCGWNAPRRPTEYRIMRTMSEQAFVPDGDLRCCKKVEEVWVPTQWHAALYRDSGCPVVHVVAETVNTDFLDPSKVPKLPKKKFTFLSTFRWTARKGWDVLLEAYWAAFARDDDVVLKLRTYQAGWERTPGGPKGAAARLARDRFAKDLSDLAEVHWVGHLSDTDESREAMRNLYGSSDVFVLPTRGEGWGLPIMEAMSMSLPAIVTNFSGPTAFVDARNGFPLQYKLQNRQAEPDRVHLRKLMRHVFEHPSEVSQKGAIARQDILHHWSAEKLGDEILSRLQQISESWH
uniref:Glycosyl transferase family 1 domain-containing protein n=1 Tax=Eutreptiella gymnastica TaxID=73025 RepID=A0A7S4GIR9_9EUGL